MSPTYRGGPNSASLGKIKNLKLIKFFLVKLIFHKTDWVSLVLLYLWVTYELVKMNFCAQNENFRSLEIFAIVNPIVN